MSIEQTLERIAVGIEKLIALQEGLPVPTATTPPAPLVGLVQAPVGGPLVGGPPQLVAVPTPMPGPSGTGPGQAMPQAGPAPVPGPQAAPAPMAQPAAAPAVNTGLLDQIRDAANQFHRAHPERAGEVWQILSAIGAQKIDAIPAQSQAQVLAQLQALQALGA